ncbi:MAG: aldehyde dehydrogenase family protein, partial [Candidatus Methanoplasma sp.]|nr:aldehyde dehydrogenase family protein [Candidatus Methanoplasma sp.]
RPSDIKKAAKDVVDSAFVSAGQRLYSTSKVIVTADSQQKFADALLEYVKTINVGDPAEEVAAGPLVSEEKLKEFSALMESVRGRVLFGGKQIKNESTSNGCYVVPAVIAGSDDDQSYFDSGLPVLSMTIVADFDGAMEELSNTESGLSAGIFSKDRAAVHRFREEATAPFLFYNESNLSLKPAAYATRKTFVK